LINEIKGVRNSITNITSTSESYESAAIKGMDKCIQARRGQQTNEAYKEVTCTYIAIVVECTQVKRKIGRIMQDTIGLIRISLIAKSTKDPSSVRHNK
jgi:hypothetical protein